MNTLKQLCTTNAVSGNEMYLIPRVFPELIEQYAPENMPLIDALGNVTLFRRGRSSEKTVAVIAHTDEAGFIIKGITDKGFLKFEEVGSIDPRVVISKKVTVGNDVKGIIGMKAIHLQKRSERESVVPMKDLFIDIGAKSKAAALKRVKIGDYVSFATEFGTLCEGVIKGKALDRAGAYCLSQVINEEPAYDTYYIFAAQKHIGSRGAMVALERIKPDLAIILDTVETADLYKAKPHETTAKLHGGAVTAAMDTRGISDRTLIDTIHDAAKRANIPVQSANTVPSESEIGAVRSAYSGTKAALIAIPCRYTNSPLSLMAVEDIENVIKLVKEIVVN
jgi:endoglucanase